MVLDTFLAARISRIHTQTHTHTLTTRKIGWSLGGWVANTRRPAYACRNNPWHKHWQIRLRFVQTWLKRIGNKIGPKPRHNEPSQQKESGDYFGTWMRLLALSHKNVLPPKNESKRVGTKEKGFSGLVELAWVDLGGSRFGACT